MLEPRRVPIALLPKQLEAVEDIETRTLVFSGGYRSGKTFLEVVKAIDLGLRNWPEPLLFVAPSFAMVRGVFVAEAKKLCAKWGFAFRWQEARKILTIGSRRPITILCRSADSPRSLEGLTVAGLIIDEWELCAVEAVIVAMARVSIGKVPQTVLGGTPEGFGPGYDLIVRRPKEGTRIITSKTSDNPFVLRDYVDDMASRMTEEQIQEKLYGERTMPSNRVYTRFDRKLHIVDAAKGVAPCVEMNRARLEVWCDFNVSPMAWGFVLVDHVRKSFHVVGELVVHGTDSQRQAAEAMKWIQGWHTRQGRTMSIPDLRTMKIRAVCDASGDERSAITPLSHVINLQQAGFSPVYGAENPRVADRVAAVQKALGGRSPLDRSMWPVRLTFDEKNAPYIVSCISAQPRDKDGSPSKDPKHGLDHGSDLVGYGVMQYSPAYAPATSHVEEEHARRWEKARGGT